MNKGFAKFAKSESDPRADGRKIGEQFFKSLHAKFAKFAKRGARKGRQARQGRKEGGETFANWREI